MIYAAISVLFASRWTRGCKSSFHVIGTQIYILIDSNDSLCLQIYRVFMVGFHSLELCIALSKVITHHTAFGDRFLAVGRVSFRRLFLSRGSQNLRFECLVLSDLLRSWQICYTTLTIGHGHARPICLHLLVL